MHESLTLFKEVQRFRQWWVWLLVLVADAGVWYVFILQILQGKKVGTNPAPDVVVIGLWVVLGILFPVLFFTLNLTTEVRPEGLYIRYFPFHIRFHKISYAEIKRFEARTYSPIRDYGGYGIRYGRKGKAYNVSGNQGIQLEFMDGKRLLIGTQRPEEFLTALSSATGKRPG